MAEVISGRMIFEINTEIVAFIGMFLILIAFFLETRSVIHSKAPLYLILMAIGSGLLAIRAYLIQEWAFLILEVAWFMTAMVGFLTLKKNSNDDVSSDDDSNL
jgi:membrane glycosyltransferase